MEDRDAVAEAGAEAAERLRRQCDLGHEHDRRPAALDRRRAGLEVDLGLAAPRLAVEQEMSAAALERIDDPTECGSLRLRQLGLLRVDERVPLPGRRLLLPP